MTFTLITQIDDIEIFRGVAWTIAGIAVVCARLLWKRRR